jgi:hypothetical protein
MTTWLKYTNNLITSSRNPHSGESILVISTPATPLEFNGCGINNSIVHLSVLWKYVSGEEHVYTWNWDLVTAKASRSYPLNLLESAAVIIQYGASVFQDYHRLGEENFCKGYRATL